MNKKPKPTVRLNLSRIMDEKGLSKEDVVSLCEKAGTPISRTTVYNLLNPYARAIRLSSITALCNGLKIEPADLFTKDGME